MLCALIMAGGKGERFWPLSTEDKPKQFLKLLGDKTMIQMTINRLIPIIPKERIFVVTADKYVDLVHTQLPYLPIDNIIAEPVGRNTAPCIALSAFIINKKYKNTTMVVLPSDHIIGDEVSFRNNIIEGQSFLNQNEEAIVTFGMKPNRPEIGYGYIQYDKETKVFNDRICKIQKVNKFVEKPNLEKANEYLREGNFLWNGGMFIWKTKKVLELTKEYLKDTYEILQDITTISGCEFNKSLKEKYHLVQSISVDYGIMEKVDNIYVIPCDFGWDDVGSWHAVERYREKDEKNNVCIGNSRNIKGNNNIIVSNSKPIVVVGMDKIFVVESDNIIYVGKKEDIDNIKEIRKLVG